MIIKRSRGLALQAPTGDGGWTQLPLDASHIARLSNGDIPAGDPAAAYTDKYRGIVLDPGTRLLVKGAAANFPAYAQGLGHFYAQAADPGGEVTCYWTSERARAPAHTTTSAAKRMAIAPVPPCAGEHPDLAIEATGRSPVFVGIHRLLDRRYLYSQCTGRGVEIGPGAKPQILPGGDTAVQYVEQATPAEWEALYGSESIVELDPTLWGHYVVGNADRIPAQPGELDFVFSSHVVEHLANPLGHFAYWSGLLRDGGKTIAIIPDREGCKDFVFADCSIEELGAELKDGSMEVELRHYQRWSAHRMPGRSADEIMQSGRSIHVHFYTPRSMASVLERFHREIGYSSFQVISSQNHKDFFVVLEK